MPGKVTLGQMDITVQVVRRSLVAPLPGRAEPRHDYAVVFTTRAKVKSAGTKEFATINIGGESVTHTFTIRYTTLKFDSRDFVRTVDGSLHKILRIDNVDYGNELYSISTCLVGNETVEAAR